MSTQLISNYVYMRTWGRFVQFYPLSHDWMRLIELWFFAEQKLTKARVKNTRSLWDRKEKSS